MTKENRATPSRAVTTPISPTARTRPGGPKEPFFQVGDLVAGRYRITRHIAQGGMGEVYEAEDVELHERVALKTILPEEAKDWRTLLRFKREVVLSRRVTHPNICRIFDVGFHRRGQQEERIPFFTMELLSGVTLRSHVLHHGPMDLREALPLIRDMAAALMAAHQLGIVHRDFKSENVFLCPASSGLRAVVTDFGLARRNLDQVSEDCSLTVEGAMVGTPAYMAPEQVRGETATPAADIYAFGVVIYEMVTGEWPFSGESSGSIALARLRCDPVPPRRHRADLPARWEEVILRCLARAKEERFADAQQVVDALAEAELPQATNPPKRPRRRVILFGALALLFAVGSAALLVPERLQRLGGHHGAAHKEAEAGRRSVAVLGFRNASGKGDLRWLETALTEMLATEMAAGDRLRVVPSERVAQMRSDLALDGEVLGPRVLEKVHGYLGTSHLLTGSYVVLEPERGKPFTLRVDARLVDAASGEVLSSLAESGSEEELFQLVMKLGAGFRGKLGLPQLSREDALGVRAALPRGREAARLFVEALDRRRLSEFPAALEALEKAAAAEPESAIIRYELSDLLDSLGYEQRAREEAARAFSLAGEIRGEQRLLIEARHAALRQDLKKLFEIYRALFDFYPDNLEHGLNLAGAQLDLGEAKEALATLSRLRRLPLPAGADPWIDLTAAMAHQKLLDFPEAVKAAQAAARKGEALGARYLIARARLSEGWSRHQLGELGQAIEVLLDARQRFAELGHKKALSWALDRLGTAYLEKGDLGESTKARAEAVAILREIGNRGTLVLALSALSDSLLRRGDLKQAIERAEEALSISAERIAHASRGVALSQRAAVLLAQGKAEEAQRVYTEARALHDELGSRSRSAQATSGLARCQMLLGDLKGARETFESVEKLVEGAGMQAEQAEVNLLLSQLALEEGKAEEAEERAQRAQAYFHREKASQSEARADAILARAQLLLGKRAQAETAAAAAQALVRDGQDVTARLASTIAWGRVLAHAPEPARRTEGDRLLLGALEEAGHLGLLPEWFEAQVGLAESAARAGRADQVKLRVKMVDKVAKKTGLGLYLRRAALLGAKKGLAGKGPARLAPRPASRPAADERPQEADKPPAP